MADSAADELQFLARELRRAGSRDVLAELRRGLRDAAGPAASAARESILATPSHHAGTLRRGIAGTVKVSTSLGASTARVRISATGPEQWPAAAVKLEGEAWNHPVYARGNRFTLGPSRARRYRHLAEGARPLVKRGAWTWVRQFSPRPGWFERAAGSHQDEFDRAVDKVTEGIERRLAGEA
jgi:hypothetical protein